MAGAIQHNLILFRAGATSAASLFGMLMPLQFTVHFNKPIRDRVKFGVYYKLQNFKFDQKNVWLRKHPE